MRKRVWFGLLAMLAAGPAKAADWPAERDALIACAPPTYHAALDCLDAALAPATKAMLTAPGGTGRTHFGLGLFIRNAWGLWQHGQLARSMEADGFVHPDDMSGTIIDGYVARLRGERVDLQTQAKAYAAFWAAPRNDANAADKAMAEVCAHRLVKRGWSVVVPVCDNVDNESAGVRPSSQDS